MIIVTLIILFVRSERFLKDEDLRKEITCNLIAEDKKGSFDVILDCGDKRVLKINGCKENGLTDSIKVQFFKGSNKSQYIPEDKDEVEQVEKGNIDDGDENTVDKNQDEDKKDMGKSELPIEGEDKNE